MGMEFKPQEAIIKKTTTEGSRDKMALLEDIRKEWLNVDFGEKDLIDIFDQKYPNNENFHGMTLLSESGTPVEDKEGKRVFITDLKDVSEYDKKRHMRGVMKKFNNNMADYVEELSKEKEILNSSERNGSKLKKLTEEYNKNEK